MTTLERNPQVVSDDDTARLWRESENQEVFLGKLRALGAQKIESIRSLRHLAGISLGEAKEIVHLSPVWADRRAADDAFHEDLYETALKAGFIEVHEDAPVPDESRFVLSIPTRNEL